MSTQSPSSIVKPNSFHTFPIVQAQETEPNSRKHEKNQQNSKSNSQNIKCKKGREKYTLRT